MLFKIAWAVLFLTTAGIAVESPGISTYWYKGNQVDVQTLDGVTVQASVMNLGKYNRVDIRVLNKATGPVTVQPESVALTITGDEHDVDLAQLSERDVDRSVSRDLLVGNLLNGFVASASAQITTAGVMALDYPDAKAARFHPSRAEAAAARREQISELLLQRVTVLPNQAAIGSVFFRVPASWTAPWSPSVLVHGCTTCPLASAARPLLWHRWLLTAQLPRPRGRVLPRAMWRRRSLRKSSRMEIRSTTCWESPARRATWKASRLRRSRPTAQQQEQGCARRTTPSLRLMASGYDQRSRSIVF